VLVTDDTVKGKRTETIMRYGAVTDEMINNPSIMVLGVLTPDVLYSDDLMLLSMIAWMKMRWLNYRCQRENSGVLSGTTTIIF
jgi:hypothetical protein